MSSSLLRTAGSPKPPGLPANSDVKLQDVKELRMALSARVKGKFDDAKRAFASPSGGARRAGQSRKARAQVWCCTNFATDREWILRQSETT